MDQLEKAANSSASSIEPAEKAAVAPALQASPAPGETRPSGGGTAVLQWLSYAFWFWFAISTTWLAGAVISYFIRQNQQDDWAQALVYPLSAVITLLLISVVTDVLYAKYEQAKKSGAGYVIMLLHVVPFILIVIGSLVAGVFSLITMLLNSDPANGVEGPLQAFWTAVVAAVLFSVLAIRVFFGGANKLLKRGAWLIFGLLAVGFIVAAILGPIGEASRTKQDRLVETALPMLASDIRDYAVKNDKLPASLGEVRHNNLPSASSVQALIDAKLVTYKPNSLPAKEGNSYTPGDTDGAGIPIDLNTTSTGATVQPIDIGGGTKRFYYQLCTAFTAERKSTYTYESQSAASYTTDLGVGAMRDYRYDSVYSIAEHPKGQVCYNLYADGKYTYDDSVKY